MYQVANLESELSRVLATDDVVQGKRVIMRACLNVPLDADGQITDPTRINEALPEIRRLTELSSSLIILAHLGRPEGQIKPEFSLVTVQEYLQKELSVEVGFATSLEDNTQPGKVTLMENIRFNGEEESKDPAIRMEFAKQLAQNSDIYINDAFPDYREAASTYELAQVLPAYLGNTYAAEVSALAKFSQPERPFVAVLGGAKLSEKLDVLQSLARHADQVLIGGAMAYTLLKAQGVNIGKSLVEEDKLAVAAQIMAESGAKILLPIDHLTLPEFKEPTEQSAYQTISNQAIPADLIAVDIGPQTQAKYITVLSQAQSILWNGPLGVFEWSGAAQGTESVARSMLQNTSAYKLAGGGDSIAAITKFNLQGFNHISTGGGAMLAFLAYDKFPTLDIILAPQNKS